MREFTFVNMAEGNEDFVVHARGCRDLSQPKYRRANGFWHATAATAAEAVQAEVDEMAAQDQEWPVEAFKVYPCAA